MKGTLRVAQRHRVQVQRIGEPHVEGRGKPQLLADPHREHAAMHEYGAAAAPPPVPATAPPAVSWIAYRCMAGNRQMACKPLADRGAVRQRIHHGVGVEAVRIGAGRGQGGGFVAAERWRSGPPVPRRGGPVPPPTAGPVRRRPPAAIPSPLPRPLPPPDLPHCAPSASKKRREKKWTCASETGAITPGCLHRAYSSG